MRFLVFHGTWTDIIYILSIVYLIQFVTAPGFGLRGILTELKKLQTRSASLGHFPTMYTSGHPPPQHYNHRNYCHRLGQYGRLSLPENNRITNNLIWLTTIKNKYSLRKSENTLYRFYTISLYTKRMFTSDERSEFRILFETIFRIKSSVN